MCKSWSKDEVKGGTKKTNVFNSHENTHARTFSWLSYVLIVFCCQGWQRSDLLCTHGNVWSPFIWVSLFMTPLILWLTTVSQLIRHLNKNNSVTSITVRSSKQHHQYIQPSLYWKAVNAKPQLDFNLTLTLLLFTSNQRLQAKALVNPQVAIPSVATWGWFQEWVNFHRLYKQKYRGFHAILGEWQESLAVHPSLSVDSNV